MSPQDVEAITQILAPHARELGFGTVSIIAKVHKNNVFDIDSQQFTSHATPGGNPEAVKLVIKLIKGMQETLSQAGSAGTLTLTLDFNKQGQTSKVVVQNTDKHSIK